MSISFAKMQALSNDFVVIDATQTPFSLSSEQVARMGDRHLGVGFDQLLLLEPPRGSDEDFYYRIFNTDGSEVGQCGNGARCMALYIKQMGLSDQKCVVLQTQETAMRCQVLSDNWVSVMLDPPKFLPEAIPFDPSQPPSSDLEFAVVNVGNPHAVIVVEDVEAVDLPEWGSMLSDDKRFPEGVNVSVMAVQNSQQIHLRVFERGVGETEACGSAACAAMVLGRQQELLDQRVVVSQPGGDLEIVWQSLDSSIEMLGPAEFVFRGEYLSV